MTMLSPRPASCPAEDLHRATEEEWEERTLNLLHDSKIDQEFSELRERKSSEGEERSCSRNSKSKKTKKHKLRWMRRPMAIPGVITEFFHEDLREEAIRALANFLVERRTEDPDNYNRTGFLVFYSCGTMSILLQELLGFSLMMADGMLTVRSIRRVANVLTLFQCVAANLETRQKFVDCQIPVYLLPLMCFSSTLEIFENARAVAISVIGILCQGRDSKMIQWMLDNDIIDVCCKVLDIGNELSKVIAMHVIESVLRSEVGICFICNHANSNKLMKLVKSWNDLVPFLASDQEYSPRLLYHVIRCYILLCTHPGGLKVAALNFPKEISRGCFHDTLQELPVIKDLLYQLEKMIEGVLK